MYQYISGKDNVHRRLLHIFDIIEAGVGAPIPYLVIPWAPGGSLAQYFKLRSSGIPAGLLPLPAVVRAIAMQLADVLDFLHGISVVHTDIKPGNLMFDNIAGRVVVVDFNAAERVDAPDFLPAHETLTTAAYRAPELCEAVVAKTSCAKLCTPGIDIWSYGVVVAETFKRGDSLFGACSPSFNICQRILTFSKSRIGSAALEHDIGISKVGGELADP